MYATLDMAAIFLRFVAATALAETAFLMARLRRPATHYIRQYHRA
jgi:hypothetical protein